MKYLYLLVSNEKDIYYEQTLVSVISLRHHNPDAFVSLVVDDRTAAGMTGFRALIKEYVQEFKVVEFDASLSNKVRSRYLKTNMRNWIDGDFLFIDGDTAVVAPIEVSFDANIDIAAVSDLHAAENDKYHVKHKKINQNIAKTGFTFSLKNKYYNSGVIYAKDSPKAREFCDKWFELYKYCVTKGIETDQLSFNEVNHRMNFVLTELPGEWNCQVREAYNHLYRVKTIYPFLCGAKIVHFFGSGIDGRREPHPLMRKDFFERIKSEEKVNEDAMNVIIHAKNVFIGAPEILDEQKKFPLFFTYRQFPRIFKIFQTIKNLLGV